MSIKKQSSELKPRHIGDSVDYIMIMDDQGDEHNDEMVMMVASNVSCQARQAQTTYPGWFSIKLLPMDINSRFFSHKKSSIINGHNLKL